MKKILAFVLAVAICGGTVFAQKLQKIDEKDVKVSYVKDFQSQVKDPTNVVWWRVDSLTFKVTYLDNENSRQAMLFNNKGSETHYYYDEPTHAMKKYVAENFAGYQFGDVWARKQRNKMTLQAEIYKKSGFLFWRKESDRRVLDFELDGKIIEQ